MTISTEKQALLWARVHAALDRREDPLADPALAQALSDAPELAAQVVQLLVGLEGLGPAASELRVAPSRRPRTLRTLALLGSAATLMLIGWGAWRSLIDEQPEPELLSESSSVDKIEVQPVEPSQPHFRTTIERTSLEGRRLSIRTNGLLITEFHPSSAGNLFPDEAGLGAGLRPSAGDVLIYERFTALPFHH